MDILAYLNPKGGPGKSSLSAGTCEYATNMGLETVLIRLEGTVSFDHRPYSVIDVTEKNVSTQNEIWLKTRNEMVDRQDEIDLCVIDSAANAVSYDLNAIEMADICLVPVTMDLQSFEYARKSIEAARSMEKNVFVIPNMCNPNSHSDSKELLKYFSRDELLHTPDGIIFRIPRLASIGRLNKDVKLRKSDKEKINEIFSNMFNAIKNKIG